MRRQMQVGRKACCFIRIQRGGTLGFAFFDDLVTRHTLQSISTGTWVLLAAHLG